VTQRLSQRSNWILQVVEIYRVRMEHTQNSSLA
jgi:hypothetical protein